VISLVVKNFEGVSDYNLMGEKIIQLFGCKGLPSRFIEDYLPAGEARMILDDDKRCGI
jgi:hypothetical protein